jgi:hypothetical protein
MTDDHDKPLAPTAFAPAGALHSNESQPPPPRLKGWLPAGLALLVLLWVVVFFLPDWVAAPTDESAPAATELTTPAASNRPVQTPASLAEEGVTEDGPSPFAEAQTARQRRAAQDILQPLLELQEFLQERGVDLWAADAYASAVAIAEEGDVAYRERDFNTALERYQAAAVAMEALEQQLPAEVEASKQRLRAAIEALDPEIAAAEYETLGVLAPDDLELLDLNDRLTALPTVIEALEQGLSNADADDWEAAVTAVERAVAADGEHQLAAARLDDYRQARTRARFNSAMSDGYRALAAADYQTAEQQFNAAARLRPGTSEPATALQELEAARIAAELRALRDEAQRAEADEQWSDALARYQEALATDDTLVFAREGIARTEKLAQIFAAAQAVVDAPERLVEAPVLRDAQQVLVQLQALGDSGPRYTELLDTLQSTLREATTPVTITLQSDGLTDVTITRVKRLGTFSEQRLTLRPGAYTAVGIRNGFRDVRVNFEVSSETAQVPVMVRCTEAI